MTVALGVPLVLLVVALVLGRFVLHGPVSPRALMKSVESRVPDVAFHDRCQRTHQERAWTCEIATNGGSSSMTYEVVVDRDSSCWTARPQTTRIGSSEPTRGCVHLWQWSLL
jgi:hypothetical protein